MQDVFDKDMISKDFMGKVTLTAEKLKELSIKVQRELYLIPSFNCFTSVMFLLVDVG